MTPEHDDGDFEYDQAHEMANDQVPPTDPDALADPQPASSSMPVMEPDGDYSYDQAHDARER